jgi:hypothetical protein
MGVVIDPVDVNVPVAVSYNSADARPRGIPALPVLVEVEPLG